MILDIFLYKKSSDNLIPLFPPLPHKRKKKGTFPQKL